MKWFWYTCVWTLFACEWSRPPNATCIDHPGYFCSCVFDEDPGRGTPDCPEDYGCCVLTITQANSSDARAEQCICEEPGGSYLCGSFTDAAETSRIRVANCTANMLEDFEYRRITPTQLADDEPR